MSTIEKMEIQAIRSFGPEAADAQRITFCKPLTLILGPNGTGKTTIIECLKYATTGDMPPGGNKNGAFIHDPKLAREREIKGQVKLSLKDVTGVTCTVVRSLLAKVKDAKGGIGMQQWGGEFSRLKPNGEEQKVIEDLNGELITALGVSKAVLENVVFCHQEDSNWPLGEGKMLKLKFDAIFDATRYTKVLEELKKIQQTQTQDIREGKIELKNLKEKKEKSRELQSNLDDLEAKLSSSEASVEDVKTKLKPIKARLEQIGKHSNEIYKLQTAKQKCVTEKEQIERTIQDLKRNIKNPYTGSVNQLKRELEEFTSKVLDKKEKIDEFERQLAGFVANLEKTAREKSHLLLEVGKLQQEADTHEKNIRKRNEKIKELAEEYNFEGFETASTINDDSCRRFFSLMKERLTESMEEAKSKKFAFEEDEKKFQNKVDNLKENKTKLEHSEKLKREMMEKNKREIQDMKLKLRHMASSAEKLGKIETDLKRAELDLKESEKTMDCDEVKSEIEQDERLKRQLDSDISKLNSEMNRLHKQSEAQTQLDMLKADQEEKMGTVTRLQNIHEDNVVGLLGHMPVEDLRLSIETYISSQTDSVKKANSDLVTMKTSLSSKEAEKGEASNQLRRKEKELGEKEDKIYSICENQDFEEELSEVQKSLTQAQEEKGSLLGADHMIKKYIKSLEKNNPNCPLCHRGFERAQEVRELILKLDETRRKVPHNMRKAEEDMEKLQKKYDDLMQLKPVRENMTVLKEQDIPAQKNKVKKLEEEIKKMKQSKEDKEEELMAKESDLEIVSGMHPDIVLMDRYKGEVRELERKIAAQSAMLSGNGSNRSLKVVIPEKESKQLELDSINRTLDHKRDRISEFQEQLQRVRSKVNELRGEKLNIEGELQQKSQLENTKATLISDNTNFERDIEESRAQIQPLEGQISKVIKEKELLIFKKEEIMARARELSDSIVNNGNAVKSINNEIKSYIQSGKTERQAECQERQSNLTATHHRLEQEQETTTEELNVLRKDVATQQIRERELQDSLQLFKKEDEIKTLIVSIQDLDEKLVDFDVKNLERERQKLLKDEEGLTLDLHRASGRQQGFKDEIRSKRKDLQSDMYRDADKKYNEEAIKNRTLEITSRDLDKYYRAMDQAIMRYHNAKMEEINRIILHLWRKTYQGNDIDTIEIRSENDNTGQKSISSRRTYNYRVVMIKNNIPIDMRGRCSAGQKVLASLIIRLALAETFCVNCGVLALDEPTTNLDRENIESLAIALVGIIEERRTVHHFQLVVITHDADFVELLGRADYVSQFVEVSKNDEGLSRLNMRRVEDLHTR